jgi:hypothetical protein
MARLSVPVFSGAGLARSVRPPPLSLTPTGPPVRTSLRVRALGRRSNLRRQFLI